MIKKMNIKGENYKVVVRKMPDSTIGECDKYRKTISLSEDVSGRLLHETFFHEFFHAVAHEIGIDCAISDELEEIIVDNFATALVKLMNNELKKEDLED